jgi:hypothetical protein
LLEKINLEYAKFWTRPIWLFVYALLYIFLQFYYLHKVFAMLLFGDIKMISDRVEIIEEDQDE